MPSRPPARIAIGVHRDLPPEGAGWRHHRLRCKRVIDGAQPPAVPKPEATGAGGTGPKHAGRELGPIPARELRSSLGENRGIRAVRHGSDRLDPRHRARRHPGQCSLRLLRRQSLDPTRRAENQEADQPGTRHDRLSTCQRRGALWRQGPGGRPPVIEAPKRRGRVRSPWPCPGPAPWTRPKDDTPAIGHTIEPSAPRFTWNAPASTPPSGGEVRTGGAWRGCRPDAGTGRGRPRPGGGPGTHPGQPSSGGPARRHRRASEMRLAPGAR